MSTLDPLLCFAVRRQYLALKSEPAREEVVKAHQDVDAWLATFTGASDKTDDRQVR